jgi:pilus assembly protein CpaB
MKTVRVVIVVALSALAAGLNVYAFSAQQERRCGGELVRVLAVGRNIVSGRQIAASDLAKRTVPRAYLDERAVSIEDEAAVVGAVAAVDLRSGQVLLWSDLGRQSQEATLAQKLPTGQRAMTIRVDRSSSLSGLLRPGHRVDILCTLAFAGRGSTNTVTALQNVLVLATGERTEVVAQEPLTSFDTVTLSVGVDQAQRLALASATGKLTLVLRGHDDLAVQSDLPDASLEDLRVSGSSRGLSGARKPLPARVIERLMSR